MRSISHVYRYVLMRLYLNFVGFFNMYFNANILFETNIDFMVWVRFCKLQIYMQVLS